MATVTGNYTLHVDPQPQPLSLSPASGALPGEQVGSPASGTVSISGGTPPYTVQESGLPTGVSAVVEGSNITLSGTPTAAGDFTPNLTVTDSAP